MSGGLFGYVKDGFSIENIIIESGEITGNQNANTSLSYTGALIGYAHVLNEGITIKNCHIKENVTVKGGNTNKSYTGGLIGYVGREAGPIEINYCENLATINSENGIQDVITGGIIGYAFGSGDITLVNCNNGGEIIGEDAKNVYAGGLVGFLRDAGENIFSIKNCHNIGNVNANSNQDAASVKAGGLFGDLRSNGTVSITLSTNQGNITTSINENVSYTGGLIGYMLGQGNPEIYISVCSNSLNTIESYSNNRLYTGGLVGLMNPDKGEIRIEKAFSNSEMFAESTNEAINSYSAGICGSVQTNETKDGIGPGSVYISECYATGSISGRVKYCGGITGQFESKGVWSEMTNCITSFDSGLEGMSKFRVTNNIERDGAGKMEHIYGNIPGEWDSPINPGNGELWSGSTNDRPFFDEMENQVWDSSIWYFDEKDVNKMPTFASSLFEVDAPTIDAPELPNIEDALYNPDELGSIVYGNDFTLPAFDITLKGRTLIEDIDYTLSTIKEGTVCTLEEAGDYEIVFKGIGLYTGEHSIPFSIVPKNIADNSDDDMNTVTYTAPDQDISISYGGKNVLPANILNQFILEHKENLLIAGTDYTFSYENNNRPGTATLIIKGTGNYQGEIRHNYQIRNVVSQPDPEPEVYYTVTVNIVGRGNVDIEGLNANGMAAALTRLTVNTTPDDEFELFTITIETARGDEFEIDNNGSFNITSNTVINVRFVYTDPDPNTDPGDPTGNETIEDNNKIWTSGGRLYIETSQSEYVRIVSINGRTVAARSISSGETSFDLPRGIYVVALNNKKAVKVQVQ